MNLREKIKNFFNFFKSEDKNPEKEAGELPSAEAETPIDGGTYTLSAFGEVPPEQGRMTEEYKDWLASGGN